MNPVIVEAARPLSTVRAGSAADPDPNSRRDRDERQKVESGRSALDDRFWVAADKAGMFPI